MDFSKHHKRREGKRVMKKKYSLYITEEQDKEIQKRAEMLGFSNKSDYIRFMIFMDISFIEKINSMYKKVCEEKC